MQKGLSKNTIPYWTIILHLVMLGVISYLLFTGKVWLVFILFALDTLFGIYSEAERIRINNAIDKLEKEGIDEGDEENEL